MTQSTETVSQRARKSAKEFWNDDADPLMIELLAGAFARFERSILSEHDSRVEKLEAENARLREATRLLDELRGNFLRALTSTEKEG